MFNRSRNRRRSMLAVVSLLLMAVAAAGCGGSEKEAASDKRMSVDFANITDSAPLFKLVKDGVVSAAAKMRYPLKTYDNNFDAQTTLRNAQLMVQDKPDVILEYNGVEGVAKSIEALFERSKIPCVAVNTPGAAGCHWFNLYNRQLCGDTAKVVAGRARAQGWTGKNTSVILVQAASAGPEINTCMGYFYEELQRGLPDLAPIDSYKDITPSTTRIGGTTIQIDGKAQLEPSFTAVSNALQSIPRNRNVILYTVNDDSTLGGWRAISRSGRAKRAMTAGLGGSEAGLQQLRTNPRWVAEGDIFFYFWGQYLMAMAKAIEDGAEIPRLTTSPIAVLTKSQSIPGTIVAPIDRYYRPGATRAHRLPPLQPVARRHTNSFGDVPVGNEYLADTGVLQQFGNVEGVR